MRNVQCPYCRGRTKAYSTRSISEITVEQYHSCRDPSCGATFVCRSEIAHVLHPSRLPGARLRLPLMIKVGNTPPVALPMPANDPAPAAAQA